MMRERTPPTIDFLAAGEAMVDLISKDLVESLAQAADFHLFSGGQPSNLAAAMAHLGKRAAIASCVGDDGFGHLYTNWMRDAGVITDFIQTTKSAPTTLAAVSRNRTTPEFIIFRGADVYLSPNDGLLAAAARSRIFHTSAFALARNPARETILELLSTARLNGAAVTFDPNFHPSVWPDTGDFKALAFETLARTDFTKPSLEDAHRLFGDELSAEACALRFLEAGAAHVILTMGTAGTLVAYDGAIQAHIPTSPPVIVDVTGAGDSFWAGMLSAYLEGKSLEQAACYGQAVAETKLGYMGPLQPIDDMERVSARAEDLFRQMSNPAGIS